MTCTAAWVSYVGLPSALYVRTVGGCLCRLGLGSSSGLSGGLLLSWVRVSCPFPLSDPVSPVSSKTVRLLSLDGRCPILHPMTVSV